MVSSLQQRLNGQQDSDGVAVWYVEEVGEGGLACAEVQLLVLSGREGARSKMREVERRLVDPSKSQPSPRDILRLPATRAQPASALLGNARE